MIAVADTSPLCCLVLIGEKAGRQAAKTLGLPVMCLLGVLASVSVQGRVDLGQAVDHLRRTTFRVSPELLKALFDHVSRARFEAVLRKVPDVEPDERDWLD